MAITNIDLVDTDLTTVTFDLHSATGSTNSAWGSVITKFGLGGSFTVTAPHDAERFEHPGIDGAFTTFSRRGLGAASWRQGIAGTTEANLRLGVGRLTDLLTRGTILRVVTSTTTRYLRIEPSGLNPLQGKELELHDIFQQFSFRQGLDISAACQPYWEGAEVTIGPTDVPNDPASSNGRAISVSISGDLRTPVRVRGRVEGVDRTLSLSAAADDIIDCTAHGFVVDQAVIFTSLTGGTGLTAGTTYWVIATSFAANTFRVAATKGGAALGFTTDITAGTVIDAAFVQRVHLAAHTTKGLRNAAALADYQDASNYRLCQLEANNGPWTVTLNTGVTATADTQASPGTGSSMAEVTPVDSLMTWRVRATATSVEPLRGDWDVYLRIGRQVFAEEFEAQLAWGPGTATPFPFVNPVAAFAVELETAASNDPIYSELYLGAISLPLEDTLTGLGLEVRTRDPSGAQDLQLDYLHFVSRDQQGTVVVSGGNTRTVWGRDLLTPVTNPAGGTAATPTGVHSLVLDTTTDNAGIGPSTGTVYAAGRWRITYRLTTNGSFPDVDLVVRNITSSTNVVSQTVTPIPMNIDFVVEFDANGTSAYQAQIDNPTATGVIVRSMVEEFVPALTNDSGFRTNPSTPSIERVNSSGSVTGYLGSEGVVPLVLSPGTNIVSARVLDIPFAGADGNESRRQRQVALTLTYLPRYPL